MTVSTDLQEYYVRRGAGLEDDHARPELQSDLAFLHRRVRETLAGRRVLEVACGTGYWTADIAATAQQVLATDISPDLLALARAKNLPADKVTFACADAFAPDVRVGFDACFAGFWWSHVAREQQDGALDQLRSCLEKNARLVLIDDAYVEGESTPIARTDAQRNTYQIRRLQDDARFELLKNFPTDSTLRKRLGGHLKDIRIERLVHYWLLSGRFK